MSAYYTEWFVCALAIAGFLMALGVYFGKGWFGIFVDSRNKMSLSRFQITIWTVMLFSAWFAVMIGQEAVTVELGEKLWALMGIGLGSAAGAGMVKANRGQQQIDKNRYFGVETGSPLHEAEKPSWADMFMGEEVSDHHYVDIGKVQMFLITLVVWLGYLVTLSMAPTIGLAFPELSNSMVALVGISHAGYLTIKMTPKTPVV